MLHAPFSLPIAHVQRMGCHASKSRPNEVTEDEVWELVLKRQVTALPPDSAYTLDPFAPLLPCANFDSSECQQVQAQETARNRARCICAVGSAIRLDIRDAQERNPSPSDRTVCYALIIKENDLARARNVDGEKVRIAYIRHDWSLLCCVEMLFMRIFVDCTVTSWRRGYVRSGVMANWRGGVIAVCRVGGIAL